MLGVGALGGLTVGGYLLKPAVETALNTVSTDDAYVNGHVTLVAPRVSGQVSRVLVDDNDRVKKGDVLVQLDRERFEDQVAVKKSAVAAAEADLAAAQAQTRGLIAQLQTDRFQLEGAIEDVHTQVANLRSNIATLKSRQATLELAGNNFRRGEELSPSGGISKEDFDQRRQSVKVAQAALDQPLEAVRHRESAWVLPAEPPTGHGLGEVPYDLDQNYSAIRQALGQVVPQRFAAGVRSPFVGLEPQASPRHIREARPRAQSRSHLCQSNCPGTIHQAGRDEARTGPEPTRWRLDLRYCDVRSEIDGVVTSRNVNPGNNVQAGQSLLAVRSLSEIWIDANFKETQLADLRIGQRVRCEVDMYGGRHEFDGRITGFTMGTGQTLALLPPQNATGNYVKIVQRLPVRIELTDYDPDKVPLFVGLSVVPYVYYKEPPTGRHAGAVLRPLAPPPTGPTDPGTVTRSAASAH